MAKAPIKNVWKVEYVERGRGEAGGPVFDSDTFVAGTFAEACAVADRERRRYRRAVKVRSLVAIQTLTV